MSFVGKWILPARALAAFGLITCSLIVVVGASLTGQVHGNTPKLMRNCTATTNVYSEPKQCTITSAVQPSTFGLQATSSTMEPHLSWLETAFGLLCPTRTLTAITVLSVLNIG